MTFGQSCVHIGQQPVDPFFKNVRLLLNGKGTLSGNNLLNADASLYNVQGIVRVGAAILLSSTAGQQPVGKFSQRTMYSGTTTSGNTSAGIQIPRGQIPAFGTGDFTVEMWVNRVLSNSTDISSRFFELKDANNFGIQAYLNASGAAVGYASVTGVGKLICYCGNLSDVTTTAASATKPGCSAIALTAATYHHVAFTRASGILRCFADGVLCATAGPGAISDPSNYGEFDVGVLNNFATTNRTLPGYIDDFRVTMGVARYTANFTPPKTQFPTQ